MFAIHYKKKKELLIKFWLYLSSSVGGEGTGGRRAWKKIEKKKKQVRGRLFEYQLLLNVYLELESE